MNRKRVPGTYQIVVRMLCLGLLIVTTFYLSDSSAAKAAGPGRSINNVIDDWIAVIQTQCDRRLYSQAQDSLARANQYQVYFNDKQRQKIGELSEEIDQSISEKTQLLRNVFFRIVL